MVNADFGDASFSNGFEYAREIVRVRNGNPERLNDRHRRSGVIRCIEVARRPVTTITIMIVVAVFRVVIR